MDSDETEEVTVGEIKEIEEIKWSVEAEALKKFYHEKQKRFSNGLPFDESLDKNLHDFVQLVRIKKAVLITIDGEPGSGKTTLAVHIADRLNQIYGFPPITFGEQLGRGGDEFKELLNRATMTGKKIPVIIYDEGGDMAKANWQSKFNQSILQTFETFRVFGVIAIMIFPYASRIDKRIFESQINRMVIHCSRANLSWATYQGYGIKMMTRVFERMHAINYGKQAVYSYTPGNIDGHFFDLNPERAIELEDYLKHYKRSRLQKTQEAGYYSASQIAKILNRSRGHIYKLTKKYDIQPIKKIRIEGRKRTLWDEAGFQLIKKNLNN